MNSEPNEVVKLLIDNQAIKAICGCSPPWLHRLLPGYCDRCGRIKEALREAEARGAAQERERAARICTARGDHVSATDISAGVPADAVEADCEPAPAPAQQQEVEQDSPDFASKELTAFAGRGFERENRHAPQQEPAKCDVCLGLGPEQCWNCKRKQPPQQSPADPQVERALTDLETSAVKHYEQSPAETCVCGEAGATCGIYCDRCMEQVGECPTMNVRALAAEVRRLRDVLCVVGRRAQEATIDLDRVSKERDAAREEVKHVRDSVKRYQNMVDHLKAKLSTVAEERDAARAETERHQAALTQAYGDASTWERRASELFAEVERLRDDRDSTYRELQFEQQITRSLRDDRALVRAECDRQTEHGRLLTGTLADERRRRKEVQEECERITRAEIELTRAHQAARAALAEAVELMRHVRGVACKDGECDLCQFLAKHDTGGRQR